MGASARHLWQQALHDVRGTAPNLPLPGWLAEADLRPAEPGRYEVVLPEADAAGQISEPLRAALERSLAGAVGEGIELRLRAASEAVVEADEDTDRAETAAETTAQRPQLNPLYTFDNFVTGPCNRLAHAASLAVSDMPGQAYNPLFIHASVGLGKSHLLQAISHRVYAARAAAEVRYVSCEEFVNNFITAIERGQIETFRHRFRHLDLLVIDDVHFLVDKDRTQEEFFHTFNTLYQSQKQVVLSSDSPPHDIPSLEERLISRFKWGLVVRIDRPSFETRVAIVQKKARLRGHEVPEEVVQYIASTVQSNNRELEGAVVRVLGYASLSGRELTLDLAKEALRDLVTDPARTITIQEVVDAVLRRYNVRLSDLQSKRRVQSVAMPRQVCMYLARRLTGRSLEEIGAFFGGRDHTTVLHGERKIERMAGKDAAFRGLVEAIERDILRA
jgi:chromosomal replication initiator protein